MARNACAEWEKPVAQKKFWSIAEDFVGLGTATSALRVLASCQPAGAGWEIRPLWGSEICTELFAHLESSGDHKFNQMWTEMETRDHSALAHVDFYVAGFPCQPYIMSGSRKLAKDERYVKLDKLVATVQGSQPKVFCLENVTGFKKGKSRRHYNRLVRMLKALRLYHISELTIDTKNHGIPQSRPRLYIVGVRVDLCTEPIDEPASVDPPPLARVLEHPLTGPSPRNNAVARRNAAYAQQLVRDANVQAGALVICDFQASPSRPHCTVDYCPCITKTRSESDAFVVCDGNATSFHALGAHNLLALQGWPRQLRHALVDSLDKKVLMPAIGNWLSFNCIGRLFAHVLRHIGVNVTDPWEQGGLL